MKKLLILALCLLLAAAGLPALAEEAAPEPVVFTSGDFGYVLLEDGTAEITRYNGSAETLDIPGTLDGKTVTGIGERAFDHCDNLTAVTIPDSVTTIGEWAFCECYSLTDIAIPDSVTSIGERAFFYCYSLAAITIPDSVTTIDGNPFAGCSSLNRISVSPDHPMLATIEGVLFSKSDKRLVCYPEALTADSYAIPNGIENIGESAFAYCYSLTNITIPDSVTTIGNSAFSYCYSLTNITIPDSVTAIDGNPFAGCSSLNRISVSPDHPMLATIDGVLFSKSDKRLVRCPAALNADSYAIPNGIEIIGEYAFAYCTSLTAVTIPDSVTTIGEWAFYNCDSFTAITIPDSVTAIGEGAFSYCYSLTNITIPDSVTTIGNSAFSRCDSLATITIPDSVTAIGEDAFSDCPSLTAITVGRDSYAKAYCVENGLEYTYADANDWLNG